MKQIILSMVIILTGTFATAQINVSRQSANYEAAGWKTFLLDNPQQIAIVAPPAAAQSKAELQSVKQRVAKLDEKNWRK